METLYFTLGILTAFIIIGAIGIFKIWERTNTLSIDKEDLEDYIGDTADDLSNELEKLDDTLNKKIQILEKCFEIESDELGKMIDARIKQFEQKTSHRISKLEGSLGAFIVNNNK